jgi:hypothetical protein
MPLSKNFSMDYESGELERMQHRVEYLGHLQCQDEKETIEQCRPGILQLQSPAR